MPALSSTISPVDAASAARRPDCRELPAAAVAAPFWRRTLRRYPCVLQHDETDCGAACLATILAWYQTPVALSRLRDLANVDADGASLWSVARAAESLGFHSRGLKLEIDGLSDLHLPAIVHWEGYHFIVLFEVGKSHVVVADPGRGRRRMSRREFLAGWAGVALELVPVRKLDATETRTSAWRRFIPAVRPFAGIIAEVLTASVLLSLLGLGFPLFTQMVVDRVLVNRSVDLLNMLLIGMLGIAVFQALMRAVRQLLMVHVATRFDGRLIGDFLRHTFELPMRFFEIRRVGDVTSRMEENRKVREALSGTIPGVILDAGLASTYLALLIFYSVPLALLVLGVVPVYVTIVLVFTPMFRRNEKEQFDRRTTASTHLIEAITGIGTVKAMALGQELRWKLESLYTESLLASRKGERLVTAYSSLAGFVQSASTVVFLWFGARQVMAGNMSTGQLLAFFTIAANFINPVLNLVNAWKELQEVRNAVKRLNDVFEAEVEQDKGKSLLNTATLAGGIDFEDVTFSYGGESGKPAVRGIDLEIRPGEAVAVVGRSGSGKSTLAKLALGLYEPGEGRITIDGHDLKTISHEALRRRVGAVQQENFLFSGTIRENIAVRDSDASFADVVKAARQAGAHEFIVELGLGYDTKVGERGMSLSGGQRQRIALARGLLNDPDILVLDEATSALDTESERSIQHQLEEAAVGRTTIIIAHRLSTVRHADRILVMDRGRIVESGTHEELAARDGLYRRLVGEQGC